MSGGPDYAAISAALYGSQQIVNDPAPTGEGLIGGDEIFAPVGAEEGAEAEGLPPDGPALGQSDPPPDAMIGYAPTVDGHFDDWGLLTRQDGEQYEGQGADIEAAKAGTSQVFADAGLGQREASEIMKQVKAYHSGAQAPTRDAAMKALRSTYGPQTERKIDGARRALAEAEQKIPHLRQYLTVTGAGNCPKVIGAAIRAAERKGYC